MEVLREYTLKIRAGTDTHLVYPGISSCVSVTCVLSSGSLVGAHLTVGDSDDEIDMILTSMKLMKGASSVTAVYVVGALSFWKHPKAVEFRYPARMANKVSSVMGFTKAVRAYDTKVKHSSALVDAQAQDGDAAFAVLDETAVQYDTKRVPQNLDTATALASTDFRRV